jgi:integrase
MNGYVARKGNRWYAVIYEGLDPVTGREIRRWHAAGTNKAAAERLARRLARELNGPDDRGRGLSFGAFLTQTWLPAKRIELRPSTWAGYQRIVHRHVIGELGSTQIRRLRPEQLEDLYESKLRPTDGSRPLAPKTVLEIHVVIRGALNDAVQRGYVNINVALIAKAPRQRPAEEQTAWTAAQLATFLRHAAGHRYFPAIWTAAFTGVRRSELLGLKWSDLDPKHSTVSINRGRVDVNYQVVEAPDITPQIGASRGKTRSARRCIDFDPTTVDVLTAWRPGKRPNVPPPAWRRRSGCSPTRTADRSTLRRCHRPSTGSCAGRRCRRSGSTTCATPTPPC